MTMTISEEKLLEKCREIELLCKDLYDHYAVLYAGTEEAVSLWRKTADEEQNHAEQFTLALRLKKALPCQVTVDQARVESILAQMRTVIDKVKIDPPDLREALVSAIKLEHYLAEFHLGCVVLFQDPNSKKMFNAMMASDREHIASLQEYHDRLAGVQDWRFTG